VKHALNVVLSDAAGWKEMLEEALHQTGGPLRKKEWAWAGSILIPKRPSRRGKAASRSELRQTRVA
jgi:hypothetical protein